MGYLSTGQDALNTINAVALGPAGRGHTGLLEKRYPLFVYFCLDES
jgi:hypothetical protein